MSLILYIYIYICTHTRNSYMSIQGVVQKFAYFYFVPSSMVWLGSHFNGAVLKRCSVDSSGSFPLGLTLLMAIQLLQLNNHSVPVSMFVLQIRLLVSNRLLHWVHLRRVKCDGKQLRSQSFFDLSTEFIAWTLYCSGDFGLQCEANSLWRNESNFHSFKIAETQQLSEWFLWPDLLLDDFFLYGFLN